MTNELNCQQGLDIVIFGGGSGGSVMAHGLVEALPEANISVIVPMGDSGSKTGVIREIFGGPAVGDLGKVVCAVSGSAAVKQVFDQRFGEQAIPDDVTRLNDRLLEALPGWAATNHTAKILGQAACLSAELPNLMGHTYRNLVLTALRLDHQGDIMPAAEEFCRWVSAQAAVIPVTSEAHDVVLTDRSSGGYKTIRGEGIIDTYQVSDMNKAEIRLDLGPGQKAPLATKKACETTTNSDLAVIGPGSPLTSLAPSLMPDGIPEAFAQQKNHGGLVVSIANLFAEQHSTPNLTLDQFVDFIGRHAVTPDYVIYNTRTNALPEGRSTLTYNPKIMRMVGTAAIGADVLSPHFVHSEAYDPIAALRSDLHHDPWKIAGILRSRIL